MYQVRTYEEAAASADALPVNALAGYVGVLDVLELTPWNGLPLNEDNPDGAVRQIVFGRGDGIVTYLILEHEQRVDVLRVTWAGQ